MSRHRDDFRGKKKGRALPRATTADADLRKRDTEVGFLNRVPRFESWRGRTISDQADPDSPRWRGAFVERVCGPPATARTRLQ